MIEVPITRLYVSHLVAAATQSRSFIIMKTAAAPQALIQPFDYFPQGCVSVNTSDGESSRYKSPACHGLRPSKEMYTGMLFL